MLKGINARIYPTPQQIEFINRQLGCCRLVYNRCLDVKSKELATSSTQLVNEITSLKDELPFLKEVHSKVLQQTVRNLNDAFSRFFKERKKRSEKQYKKRALKKENKSIKDEKGYPEFKSKHDELQSCRFPKDAVIGVRGNRIDLIKALKNILFKCSRKDEKYLNRHQDCIHNVTLKKTKTGKFYISVLVDFQPVPKPTSISHIGLDMGIKDLYVDSNGNRIENKRFYASQEGRLKRMNRKFSKKKDGSNNKEKMRKRIAVLNERISNRRENYLQELTTALVNENQVICVEDLNVSGMLHNHKLAKAIQDCSWSRFLSLLEWKCRLYGRKFVRIGRFYASSKTCHECGYRNDMLKLSDREWVCPECGCVIDRDYNAAWNILVEGERIIGLSSPEFKPVETPTVDDRLRAVLKSSEPFVSQSKQEKNERRGKGLKFL